MTTARGTFTVRMQPQDLHDKSGTLTLTRMVLDKTYEGDLVATGSGEMLAASTDVSGSAGYVAMERVEGTLLGREGSFVLQHSGTLTRGAPMLVVTIVPDSGTDELEGLSGTLKILITGGQHAYELEHAFPETDD